MHRSILAKFIQEHDIYLLGPMGVGKTTFVSNLRRLADINYISIGDITRRALGAPNPDRIYTIREKGRIPLSAVRAIISPYLTSKTSYILDGVPRRTDEAEWIKSYIVSRPFRAIALTLSASDEILSRRLAHRSLRDERPETPERIERRLAVYKSESKKVLGILEPVLFKHIELDTSKLSPTEVVTIFRKAVTEL